MTVTVTPSTGVTNSTYNTGQMADVEDGILWVYSNPDVPVACWAAGTWQNAVIAP